MDSKAKFVFWLLGISVFFLSSCTKDYVIHQAVEPQDTTLVNTISFSDRIIPLFQTNCIDCHYEGFDVLDLTPANAYNQLIEKNEIDTLSPANSNLYLRLTSLTNPMPPAGNISIDSIAVVLKWIEEGCRNN
jgi:hypothetical protein